MVSQNHVRNVGVSQNSRGGFLLQFLVVRTRHDPAAPTPGAADASRGPAGGPAGAGGHGLEPGPLLVAEPATTSGLLIGYGRISTASQSLHRQTDALTAAGCARIFADTASGADTARPELGKCLDYVRPGDVVVVLALDRFARSLTDLIALVAELRRRGVGFRSLHEAIDTTTPGGRLVFHVFAALAEFVRELIVTGTREGLAAARARGQRLGRPPALDADQIRQARVLLTRPDESVSSIARLLGVSRSTVYRHVPELSPAGGGRAELVAAVQAEALTAYDAVGLDGQLPGQTAIPL